MTEENKNLLEKIPPQSLEAEQSLLGSLLIDKDSIIKVVDQIMPEDFYRDAHKFVYESIRELYNNQEPIDVITLANRLEEKKQLTKIGGRAFLAQLSNTVA